MRKKSFVWVLCFLFLGHNLAARDMQHIKVIDGDSIVLNGTEIRLEGIDAPEYKQICHDKNNQKYRCGIKAREFLVDFIKGKDVVCKKISLDRYKRQVSFCYANGEDINKAMIKSGWAVAYDHYDDKYIKDEEIARKQKKGIWQGRFMRPEIWRALNRRQK